MREATDVSIFTIIMNSAVYETILDEYLKHFVATVYPSAHRLWQDKDPKDKLCSRSSRYLLRFVGHKKDLLIRIC